MFRVDTIYYLKCPVFTNYEICKETGKYLYTGGKSRKQKLPEKSQMSDLTDEDF